MKRLKTITFTLFLLLSVLAFARAQTAATIAGTVTDPQGAIVPGATVELLDTATNQSRTTTTNDAGQYQFSAVQPGVYKITVTMQGFRTSIVPSQKVQVAKSYAVDFKLEAGQISEKVEISAGAAVELQKLDATVGNVIGADALKSMPSLTRDATALINLQPMVMPGRGESNITGGQVAGARSDQNTFMLDGGDATSNTEGTGGYNTGQAGTPRAVVPTPVESLEEFRVSTNNPNATFGRSAGAQVQMVTKRGTNTLHGSFYWYHQNDNLNANTWSFNRLGRKKPELKDNRFGLSLGGPIWKDKTFIFGHYEGRRFPQAGEVVRLVPTDTLRAGILQFTDASGKIVSYNLGSSTLCGPANNSKCDPRSKGISPVVQSVFNLLPQGNDSTVGDRLNTLGFRAPIPLNLTEDFGVVRLDHHISSKWQFMTSYRYGRTEAPTAAQFDIRGGQARATSVRPLQPRYVVAGLTGQITPRLTNDFHFNWTRHWWEWATQKPFPQVAGTDAALQIAGESATGALVPINIDTQSARGRIWNGRDFVFTDNVGWVRSAHTFQFGGRITHQDIIHQRDDKVVGSLTSLIYQVNKGNNVSIPATNRPPTCGGNVTSSCLQSGDVARWNTLYAASLGIIDRAAVLVTRNGKLEPNPPGTPLREEVKVNAYEAFVNDVWRFKPSLTLSYGLTYNVQLPPVEKEGKQTLMTIGNTKEILDTKTFLERRRQAALAGKTYNPDIGFMPIRQLNRKYPYDPTYNDLGPRVALAWNPSFKEGFLGRFFGDHKTVLRGGYARSFDRINGVGIVMVPILGVGFGQTITCKGPNTAGQCLTSGTTNPTNAFRIGVDGSKVPLPTVSVPTVPIKPAINSPFELLSFQIDVKRKVGSSDGWDVTVQRELPGNMLIEVGHVGRVAHHLYQGVNLNQVPFFMKDAASGQSFAQAFDALAGQIRSGVDPTKVASQAFFENMLKGSPICSPNCTRGVAANFTTELQTGAVFDLFSGIHDDFVTGPVINDQVLSLYMITDRGRSSYLAGFVTVTKRMSHGLTYGINYTLSRSLDHVGFGQQFLNSASNAYDIDYDYGPSAWDRRHTFNAYWYHQLPFGHGGRFSTGNWLDKLIGGWYTAGIFTYASGLPEDFIQGPCQEFGNDAIFGNCAAVVPLKGHFSTSVNKGVAGSGDVGSNGDPKKKGTGLNIFADPEAIYKGVRPISLVNDTNRHRGWIRGLARWNLDMSFGKETRLTERVKFRISADFTNILNKVEFVDPNNIPGGLDLTSPQGFGVLNSQYNAPRFIQLGARFEW